MTNGDADEHFTPSRLMLRALDRKRYLDYGLAFAVGAWPILLAWLSGAHRTVGGYAGYWDSPNWVSLAILLPALLFAFRFLMARIVPVGLSWPTWVLPPIVDLVREEPAREAVYEALRRRVLSKRNVAVALAVSVIVNAADAPQILAPYFGTAMPRTEFGWTAMFQVLPELRWELNLLLLVFALAAQFAAVLLGMLAIAVMFRHNLFFLGNIYQRRWASEGEQARFFQINPKDVNRCFGFRIANVAFNAQVLALMIAGAAMFLSRYANAFASSGQVSELLRWPPSMPAFSFPLPSQWLMSLAWLVALAVVAMPAMVKLLPQIPGRGAERVDLSISNYLHEFFSDQAWPKDKSGRDEPHQLVAMRFAQNSFWPTGDNRAGLLFFFAYWIFLVTLLPPPLGNPQALAVSLVIFAVLAHVARLATFAALRLALSYVDELLVTGNADPAQQLDRVDPRSDRTRDIGVFISYRRRDSAPYARLLHDRLVADFQPERVFMDIADIGPGADFGSLIGHALEAVDAVVVVIGEKWLTLADAHSRPRIEDPADMVHLEIATALARGKRVFPVLVGGAKMPAEPALPAPLRGLARLNAIELSDTRWAHDVGQLVNAIEGR